MTITKTILSTGFSLVLVAGVALVPAAASAQTYDSSWSSYDTGCCTSSYDTTYTPSYDTTYTPSYDTTYTPSYDSTYTPSYDTSYDMSYDTTYTPSYDTTYTPTYDTSYTPTYDTTYTPSYDNTYTPTTNWTTTGYQDSYPSYSYTDTSSTNWATTGYQDSYPSYSYSTTPTYTYTSTPTYTYTSTPTYTYTTTPTYTYTPPQYIAQGGNNPVVYQPTCSISANPGTATYGGTATLTWSSNYASSATLTDAGNVSTNGSYTINNLTGTRTYTLTVYGNGGSNSCQTTVYVNQQQYQQPTCSLYADQTSVNYGGSSTLHWTSANANSASLTDAGNVSTNGSYSFSNLTGTKTYTLTVYGYNGQPNTCQTTVNVNTYQQQPYCSLSVSPNPIYDGGNGTITWTTTNASSATIDQGVGSVNAGSGSRTIYPGYSRTYTMTVYGYNGQSATCAGYANVQQNNYPSNTLSCSIATSQNYVTSGGRSYLTWTSTGATSAWLSDGIGSVATNGSLTIHPDSTTHYVLTVSDGYGRTQTCSTDTYVNGTYVSLTQVPYTGFDLGPVGDTIYWFVLAGGALAAAYFLTMYRGGAVNFALSALGARSNHIAASEEETDEDEGEAAEIPESVAPVIEEESDGEGDGMGDAMTLDTSSGMPRLVITRSKRTSTLPGQE